jgi:hypothetical protein
MAQTMDQPYQVKITSGIHNNYTRHYLHPFSHAVFRNNGKWQANTPLAQGKGRSVPALPTRKEIIDWYFFYMSIQSSI